MILDQRLAKPIYFRDIFNKSSTVDVDMFKRLGNLTVIDMGELGKLIYDKLCLFRLQPITM